MKPEFGYLNAMQAPKLQKVVVSAGVGSIKDKKKIELITNQFNFNTIRINSLNDQRHWIFIPEKITIYGFKKDKWVSLVEKDCEIIRPQKDITIYQIEINEEQFSKFSKLKIIVDNQKKLPPWKKRKNKKPMEISRTIHSHL